MFKNELTGSRLLTALHDEELTLLAPYVEEITLQDGYVLYQPGDDVQHTYFPRDHAVAAFLIAMENGEAVETALVGHEGAIGGIVSNGRLPSYSTAVVQHGGSFYRISTAALEETKNISAHMRHLFSRYSDCLLAQVFQSVACNARHTIEQRAAKWLLTAVDRTGSSDIKLTQDHLSSLLGVGRTYVSRVIQRMKQSQAIMTRRGGLRVLDRVQLEKMSCSCAHLVGRHFEHVMRGVYPATGQSIS